MTLEKLFESAKFTGTGALNESAVARVFRVSRVHSSQCHCVNHNESGPSGPLLTFI